MTVRRDIRVRVRMCTCTYVYVYVYVRVHSTYIYDVRIRTGRVRVYGNLKFRAGRAACHIIIISYTYVKYAYAGICMGYIYDMHSASARIIIMERAPQALALGRPAMAHKYKYVQAHIYNYIILASAWPAGAATRVNEFEAI